MNTGNDSGSGGDTVRRASNSGAGNSYLKKYMANDQGNSPNLRNGGSPTRDPSQWRSYSTEPDHIDPSAPAIPKFDIDPDVPLETMVPLNPTSESEQSDANSGTRSQQTGLIIGDGMLNADPTTQYEMQRKKERIIGDCVLFVKLEKTLHLVLVNKSSSIIVLNVGPQAMLLVF